MNIDMNNMTGLKTYEAQPHFSATSGFRGGVGGLSGHPKSFEQFLSTLADAYHGGDFLPNGFHTHNTHNMSYV